MNSEKQITLIAGGYFLKKGLNIKQDQKTSIMKHRQPKNKKPELDVVCRKVVTTLRKTFNGFS